MGKLPNRKSPSKTDTTRCSRQGKQPQYKFPNPTAVEVAARRSGLPAERVDQALVRAREALSGQTRGDGRSLGRFFRDELAFTELEARRLAKVLYDMVDEMGAARGTGGGAA